MSWLPFLSFVVVTTFTPGPNNLMSATLGGTRGFRAAMRFISGVIVGFLILNLAAVFFIDTLVDVLPVIEGPLKWFGAAYILYLAWKVLTAKPPKAGEETRVVTAREGILLQFANPKAIFFSLTVSSTFLVPNFPSTVALIGMCIFLMSLTLLATMSWALVGSTLRTRLEKETPRKVFNGVMALLLVYSALGIVGVI